MIFELTQSLLNSLVVVVLMITCILGIFLKIKFSIEYDKKVKLRQHKLYNTDCTFEQAVSNITIVNGMEEGNYGLQQKKL